MKPTDEQRHAQRLLAVLALRGAHPDWSDRMLLAALNHGENSPEFLVAKARAAAFHARFEATGGWMTFP